MSDLVALREQAQDLIGLTADLIDDPDCLAELEHTFSVFRFRYSWGTVYELTFGCDADAEDRRACLALMPAAHVYLETVATETLGGLTGEVTHRFVTADL